MAALKVSQRLTQLASVPGNRKREDGRTDRGMNNEESVIRIRPDRRDPAGGSGVDDRSSSWSRGLLCQALSAVAKLTSTMPPPPSLGKPTETPSLEMQRLLYRALSSAAVRLMHLAAPASRSGSAEDPAGPSGGRPYDPYQAALLLRALPSLVRAERWRRAVARGVRLRGSLAGSPATASRSFGSHPFEHTAARRVSVNVASERLAQLLVVDTCSVLEATAAVATRPTAGTGSLASKVTSSSTIAGSTIAAAAACHGAETGPPRDSAALAASAAEIATSPGCWPEAFVMARSHPLQEAGQWEAVLRLVGMPHMARGGAASSSSASPSPPGLSLALPVPLSAGWRASDLTAAAEAVACALPGRRRPTAEWSRLFAAAVKAAVVPILPPLDRRAPPSSGPTSRSEMKRFTDVAAAEPYPIPSADVSRSTSDGAPRSPATWAAPRLSDQGLSHSHASVSGSAAEDRGPGGQGVKEEGSGFTAWPAFTERLKRPEPRRPVEPHTHPVASEPLGGGRGPSHGLARTGDGSIGRPQDAAAGGGRRPRAVSAASAIAVLHCCQQGALDADSSVRLVLAVGADTEGKRVLSPSQLTRMVAAMAEHVMAARSTEWGPVVLPLVRSRLERFRAPDLALVLHCLSSRLGCPIGSRHFAKERLLPACIRAVAGGQRPRQLRMVLEALAAQWQPWVTELEGRGVRGTVWAERFRRRARDVCAVHAGAAEGSVRCGVEDGEVAALLAAMSSLMGLEGGVI